MSTPCRVLVGGAWLFAAILGGVFDAGDILLLDFFEWVSYIKIGVTLVKYVPQAVYNHRRKSTEGWSILNIMLDFTGGTFSFAQMFLQYYNNEDASVFLGDPTKLFLAIFTICFDVLFVVQHFCLYPGSHSGGRKDGYEVLPADSGTVTRLSLMDDGESESESGSEYESDDSAVSPTN